MYIFYKLNLGSFKSVFNMFIIIITSIPSSLDDVIVLLQEILRSHIDKTTYFTHFIRFLFKNHASRIFIKYL